MEDHLVQEFLAQYEAIRARETPADPDLGDLLDMEDALCEVLADLDLTLDDAQRDELRGKRVPDMTDLLHETAAALAECPDVQADVRTDPALFAHVAEQDLALGGLIQSLQGLYGAADLGLLLRCAEAARLLDDLDERVRAALRDPQLTPARRQAIERNFAGPMDLRRRGILRMKDGAGEGKALSPYKARLAEVQHDIDTAAKVRALVRDALATPARRRSHVRQA